jgi:hypothetical protein
MIQNGKEKLQEKKRDFIEEFRTELFDTFKMFIQEQDINTIGNRSALYLDYRPYVRQICQSEQNRASESYSSRRYVSL